MAIKKRQGRLGATALKEPEDSGDDEGTEVDVDDDPGEEGVEVDLDEPDDEDDEPPEPGTSQRQAKKDNRWAEHTRAREEAEQRAAEAERQRVEAEARYNELLRIQSTQPPPGQQSQQQQAPQDPRLDRWRHNYKAQQQLTSDYAGLSPDQQRARRQEFQDRLFQLKEEETRIRFEPAPGQQQYSPEQMAQVVSQRMRAERIMGLFPDIFRHQDQRVARTADSLWTLAMNEGKPDNEQTWNEIAAETRRRHRMPNPGGAPQASEAVRSKLTGIGRGAGAGAAVATGRKVKLSKRELANAMRMFKHLPEKDRIKAAAKAKLARQSERDAKKAKK